ncbi:MAG: hypothetical protein QME74_07460, partial [Candidatus Edwardsbacteria bacterium]|nr:hypothetical protein [Candidatus Edwardsbacteria bacterium]
AEDPETKVILLVSKPPHPEVLERIGVQVKAVKKPVVAVFLGADPNTISNYGMRSAQTLEEAALSAVAQSQGKPHGEMQKALSQRNEKLKTLAYDQSQQFKIGQKYIRGLFSGGTFCYEAQLLFTDHLDEIHSNAPAGSSKKLDDPLRSVGHTVVDLGEDEFTVGRPHPMIDYSLRNKRIISEAKDPETAVILLDVVLGYGSNMDPVAEIVPAIREAQAIAKENRRSLPVVCSVTGTDADPQNRAAVVSGLKACGALVMESNAAACLLAGQMAVESKSCLDVMLKQSSHFTSEGSWPGR